MPAGRPRKFVGFPEGQRRSRAPAPRSGQVSLRPALSAPERAWGTRAGEPVRGGPRANLAARGKRRTLQFWTRTGQGGLAGRGDRSPREGKFPGPKSFLPRRASYFPVPRFPKRHPRGTELVLSAEHWIPDVLGLGGGADQVETPR